MTKDQIIIQRTIGKILTKLNDQDSIMLTDYMAMLEELVYDLTTTSKPKIETGMLEYHNEKDNTLDLFVDASDTVKRETRSKKPLKSKYFTENQIHLQMFRKTEGDSCKDEKGMIFVMLNFKDLEKLNHSDYSLLRNRVLTQLNNKRKKENL